MAQADRCIAQWRSDADADWPAGVMEIMVGCVVYRTAIARKIGIVMSKCGPWQDLIPGGSVVLEHKYHTICARGEYSE